MKQVDVSTTTGSFGILPNHVPSIAVLKPGLMTVTEDDKMKKFFGESSALAMSIVQVNHSLAVSSGTVTINADSSVQILAEEAYPLEQLDIQVSTSNISSVNSLNPCLQAARQGLDQCRQQTTTGSEEERAEAQIGVELYEALIAALESS